jgi:adenylate kinase
MARKFLIFFGPPGSGKGTQAKMLGEKMKLIGISTGALLRNEVSLKTELGKLVEPIVSNGGLVDDEIVTKILEKRLKAEDAVDGAIFDGYPRNIRQQTLLLDLLKKIGIDVQKDEVFAVLINVEDREVKKRILFRRSCVCGAIFHLEYNPPQKDGICDKCGGNLFHRQDDKEEVIAARLKIYHQEIGPILDFWEKAGKLIKIDGEKSPDNVFGELLEKLEETKII